jgi:pimeloyl-ACP methyl ester carboxylesterase
MFDGFTLTMIETGQAVIRVRHGGGGPPVLLLHGFPQTQPPELRGSSIPANTLTANNDATSA